MKYYIFVFTAIIALYIAIVSCVYTTNNVSFMSNAVEMHDTVVVHYTDTFGTEHTVVLPRGTDPLKEN